MDVVLLICTYIGAKEKEDGNMEVLGYIIVIGIIVFFIWWPKADDKKKKIVVPRRGYVLGGDYAGCNVYGNQSTYFIVSGDNSDGTICTEDCGWAGVTKTNYKVITNINKNTVERCEDVAERHEGASTEAVLRGAFLMGPIGAYAVNRAGQSSSHDVAIFFADGKRSLIRLTSESAYQNLRTILYRF